MKPGRRSAAVGILLAIVFIIAAAVPEIRWRVALVALKAGGQLSDIDWQDIGYLISPKSGIRLSRLVHYRDPYTVIQNPLGSAADRKLGAEQFALHCARCHGEAARGGVGPALVGRALTHGSSDWAMYRTIRGGVPGTAMQPWGLTRIETWRIIAYLRERGYEDGRSLAEASGTARAKLPPVADVTPEHLQSAAEDVDEWLLPYGSYSGQRFSRDTQINAQNVSQLTVEWIHQFDTTDEIIETVPIVAGGRMYLTLPDGRVLALGTRDGTRLWQFVRPPPKDVRLCCIATNRGVAVLGKRVYIGTLDAHLLALDAETGNLIWDRIVADYRDGYSITSAPLAIGTTIVTGIAGGDFPTRGFLSAYDAQSGAMRWRTYTVPARGEPGSATWSGDSARTGGASTWGMGSYDPKLGLLYWGTGNPAPDYIASRRKGDNLYSASLLALDAASGRLVWNFQFTPHDDHDWDSTQTPALFDENGAAARLLGVANRNGFYYVLDRRTGRFVRGGAFARQTWASGLDEAGHPQRLPGASPTPHGNFLFPSTTGATNWWMAAFSPITRFSYVDVLERGGLYFSTVDSPHPSRGHLFAGSSGRYDDNDFHYTSVRAIDSSTAKVVWEHRNSTYSDTPRGGLLATAGGIVFASDTSRLIALDAETGQLLWSFETGGPIAAPPVTYRCDGRQFVSVAAGQTLITFALPNRPAPPPVRTVSISHK